MVCMCYVLLCGIVWFSGCVCGGFVFCCGKLIELQVYDVGRWCIFMMLCMCCNGCFIVCYLFKYVNRVCSYCFCV